VYDHSPGEGGGGCWKRQVVRPASDSFQVEEFAGKCFLPESVQHQLRALRLPDPTCCRDPEGRLAPMDCACEGVYSRAEQACGE
jgi:hypothetical protein